MCLTENSYCRKLRNLSVYSLIDNASSCAGAEGRIDSQTSELCPYRLQSSRNLIQSLLTLFPSKTAFRRSKKVLKEVCHR